MAYAGKVAIVTGGASGASSSPVPPLKNCIAERLLPAQALGWESRRTSSSKEPRWSLRTSMPNPERERSREWATRRELLRCPLRQMLPANDLVQP